MNWSKIKVILCGRSQKSDHFKLAKLASKIAEIERQNQNDISFQNWSAVKQRAHDYSRLSQEHNKLLAKYELAWGKYE